MKLGDNIYFIDFRDNSIKSGRIFDFHVTSDGHEACIIKTSEGKRQAEVSICFMDEEKAKAKLDKLVPISDKLKKTVEEMTKKANDLRERIIGKPTLKDLRDE